MFDHPAPSSVELRSDQLSSIGALRLGRALTIVCVRQSRLDGECELKLSGPASDVVTGLRCGGVAVYAIESYRLRASGTQYATTKQPLVNFRLQSVPAGVPISPNITA
jgi:hypothetical protein